MNKESLELVMENEIAILKIDDEIIFDNSNAFKEKSKKMLVNNDSNNLVLDLSQVPYIDSSGIGYILSLFKFIRSQGGRLVIANPNEKIKKVFEITKMTEVFQMYESVEKAVTEINS